MRNLLSVFALFAVISSFPLEAAPRQRIHGRVDDSRRALLPSHVHPKVHLLDDEGAVAASAEIPAITIALSQTAEQQADLEKLLLEQQDPASANYHKWLTPEQYADRFGVSQEDIAKLTDWLQQQGLRVTAVARGRNSVSCEGAASDVARAFRTELHRFRGTTRDHFANISDPSLPVALTAIVSSVQGLDNFGLHPRSVRPKYTSGGGSHYLSPEDLATIYNIKPLYGMGFTGAGMKMVIAGQSRVDLADIQAYRTRFNLPANDPETMLVPNSRDPGTVSGDMGEADLDLEVAGAVVPDAKLLYVYSYNVMTAVQYAIDQNLAPVISVSYGSCEPQTSRSQMTQMQAWARQANAQGITWINASGDSGGADCISGSSTSGGGLAVDTPSNIPEVTGIGGTRFDDSGGQYWTRVNGDQGGSALSYIPEIVWNDSAPGDPSAGGGGSSAIFSKPVWQTGPGVPTDAFRNSPDVSLAASADHVGYLIYTEGKLSVFGGTSAATPVFAGIALLMNQYLVSTGAQATVGLGNMNPRMYALAQTTSGVFHDVTSGDNIVTVTCRSTRTCTPGSFGYAAAAGYDQATGLGSVDAYNLALAWKSAAASITKGSTTVSVSASAGSIGWSGSTAVTASVKSSNGGTPTGTVTFSAGGVVLGSAALQGSGDTASGVLSVGGPQLAAGSNTISAEYAGDNAYTGGSGTVDVSLAASSGGTPSIAGLANAASFKQTFAPGMVLSIFGSELAPAIWTSGALPLPVQLAGVSVTINGVNAPIYYISPGQLNVQIPYETPANAAVPVIVNNNGQRAQSALSMAAVAPALFTDSTGALVPSKTGTRGQVITLFLTGIGAVSPGVATGAAPSSGTAVASLPAPVQLVRVTIGGVAAPVQFAGIPPGLVGVAQINCQVAVSTPVGKQQVVVTVGGVGAASATLTVN